MKDGERQRDSSERRNDSGESLWFLTWFHVITCKCWAKYKVMRVREGKREGQREREKE